MRIRYGATLAYGPSAAFYQSEGGATRQLQAAASGDTQTQQAINAGLAAVVANNNALAAAATPMVTAPPSMIPYYGEILGLLGALASVVLAPKGKRLWGAVVGGVVAGGSAAYLYANQQPLLPTGA